MLQIAEVDSLCVASSKKVVLANTLFSCIVEESGLRRHFFSDRTRFVARFYCGFVGCPFSIPTRTVVMIVSLKKSLPNRRVKFRCTMCKILVCLIINDYNETIFLLMG